MFLVVLSSSLARAADSRSAVDAARATEPVRADLPLLFDARERIARPDLTSLTRLRFLTTVDFPPFNFIDQSGKLSGFHVDLVREICRTLEIEAKCQIQALPFDELEPALDARQGEAIVAGIAVTPELRQRYAFSRPFLQLPARFAAHRASIADLPPAVGQASTGAQPESAALSGKAVGVVAGTTHEAMFRAFFPDLAGRSFPDRATMLSSLAKGEIAAVFSDGLQLSFWIAGDEAKACCALIGGAYFSQRFLGEGLTILHRNEDPRLTQALDHALLALSRSGRLADLYLRYFPNGIY